MKPPHCRTCYDPLTWVMDYTFTCPNGHIDSVDAIARMNLESAFENDPGLDAMFYRGITTTGHHENSSEYNIDLIAHELGSNVHQIHMLLAADMARSEFAELHALAQQ